MIKKLFVLLMLFTINAYANQPTVIQVQMMQNRIVKGANVDALMISICDALMDMKMMARCFALNHLGGVYKYSQNINDEKKVIDKATFEFIGITTTKCGRLPCDQVATIKLNKLDEKNFKINIKIIDGQQGNTDVETYKKYFDAIGNSLFINKTGIELGAPNE